MSYTWAPEEYVNKLSPAFLKARDLLEEWFVAMENGTAEHRMPDPFYPVAISQEQADHLVELLDEEFDKELTWASTKEAGSYTAGPGFRRLKPLQRLALAQQLHATLRMGDSELRKAA